MGIAPPGLGAPGALAEYMIVDDVRHLVPLGDLDPVASVSLTDAGLTPYHAIVSSLHALPAGSTAVVIGAGGLGHPPSRSCGRSPGPRWSHSTSATRSWSWRPRWGHTTCCRRTNQPSRQFAR